MRASPRGTAVAAAPGTAAALAFIGLLACSLVLGPMPASAQDGAAAGEFIYRTRPGDTLIGLGARLLREPRRWPELQARNRIAEPRRLPRGSEIRIPYDWLRITAQSAVVIERIGAVTVDGREPGVGATIDAGANVETAADGAVTLELADGSVVVLQPSSRLRIERLRRVDGAGADEALLELQRGKLETQVRPRGDMGRFEIRTPAAVSAVRGTEFRASYAEAGASATTETLGGTVAVSGGGGAVAVGAGFGTRADRGQAPRVPVPLLPAPALGALPALNDRAALRWQFAPVAGAAGYRHQLARDPQFRSLVADAVTTAPASEVADLADGRYWLRVRAIDGAAIEGYDASAAIEQRRRLDAPTATAPIGDAPRLGATTRFDWAALAGAGGYRFQLASDARFASPIAERAIAAMAGVAPGTEVAGLAPGRYLWRIAAVDADGVAGHWGEPQSFLQKPAPVAVEAIAAARGSDPRTQRFRWPPGVVAATGAADPQYDWQLAADASFRRVLRSGRSGLPALQLDSLPYGRHHLRVRLVDPDGFEAPFGPATRVDVPPPLWPWFAIPAVLLIPGL